MNEPTQQLVGVLAWSITTLTLQRYHDNPHADAEWAADDNRSPEMRELMEMYDALQEGRLVVERTEP